MSHHICCFLEVGMHPSQLASLADGWHPLSWCRGWHIWRTPCELALAQAGRVKLQNVLENSWGPNGLWRLLVFIRPDFLIQQQNFFQEPAGICQTARSPRHWRKYQSLTARPIDGSFSNRVKSPSDPPVGSWKSDGVRQYRVPVFLQLLVGRRELPGDTCWHLLKYGFLSSAPGFLNLRLNSILRFACTRST